MENIKVASVQFEARDNDKAYNLSVIRRMCALAGKTGADVVAFLDLLADTGLLTD